MMCCAWYGSRRYCDNVHVQVIDVRIDQAGRQAAPARTGNSRAARRGRLARHSAGRWPKSLQQFAAAVSADQQNAHEEPAVQVGPQYRGRRQKHARYGTPATRVRPSRTCSSDE